MSDKSREEEGSDGVLQQPSESGREDAPTSGGRALARSGVCRIDTDGRGLDDLAISGDLISMVRLERMNAGYFWGAIYLRDGRDLRLTFTIDKRTLIVGVEAEGRGAKSLLTDGAARVQTTPAAMNNGMTP